MLRYLYFRFESQLNRNPEFKRNIWLELSTGRLIAMPAIIAVIFMLSETGDRYDRLSPFVTAATIMYFVLIYLWGAKLAIDSIIDEVNDRTWIQQQMTPLSPWKMTLGKLFGATIYAWYGGLICLVALFFALSASGHFAEALYQTTTMLLMGVAAHGGAIALSLMNVRKYRQKKKVGSTSIYIIALILSTYLIRFAFGFSTVLRGDDYFTEWYGLTLPAGIPTLLGTILICYWAVVGAYRNMRTELQFENGVETWCWFLGTIVLYTMGFATVTEGHRNWVLSKNADLVNIPLLMSYIAVGVCGGLTFMLAFLEPKDPVSLRRVFASYRDSNWKKLGVYVPLWAVTLCVTALLSSISVLIGAGSGASKIGEESVPFLLPLAALAFLIRDVALIMWLNAGKGKSPDVSAFVYLVLLHAVFPIMFGLGSSTSEIQNFFNPTTLTDSVPSLLFGTVQAGFLTYLVINAWRTRDRELEEKYALAA